jgi:hypothetical protein
LDDTNLADFLIVFAVTFLVIAGVAIAMLVGRKPVYQPDQSHVESILSRLLDGQLADHEWQFFINMPIYNSETLENVRLKCFDVAENQSLRVRDNIVRIKEPGLIRLKHLLSQLESDGSKSF